MEIAIVERRVYIWNMIFKKRFMISSTKLLMKKLYLSSIR